MNRTFDARVLKGLFPIGWPLGEILGRNLGVSLGFSFGNSFFLAIIVSEMLLYFPIELFYRDTIPHRNVFV